MEQSGEPGKKVSGPCLGYLSCFNALNEEELSLVNSRTRHLFFSKGETICKQGVFAPYVIFLTGGLVRIYLEPGRNRYLNMHLAKSGDFISFSPVFNEETYRFSASALTDSDVCLIDKDILKQLLTSNSDFAYRIISRNWQTENRLLDIVSTLSYKHMAGKLATTVIYLADFGYDNIFDLLTRKDISEFANITIESTVKLLKEFEQQGILSLSGKMITILDRERLNGIAQKG